MLFYVSKDVDICIFNWGSGDVSFHCSLRLTCEKKECTQQLKIGREYSGMFITYTASCRLWHCLDEQFFNNIWKLILKMLKITIGWNHKREFTFFGIIICWAKFLILLFVSVHYLESRLIYSVNIWHQNFITKQYSSSELDKWFTKKQIHDNDFFKSR